MRLRCDRVPQPAGHGPCRPGPRRSLPGLLGEWSADPSRPIAGVDRLNSSRGRLAQRKLEAFLQEVFTTCTTHPRSPPQVPDISAKAVGVAAQLAKLQWRRRCHRRQRGPSPSAHGLEMQPVPPQSSTTRRLHRRQRPRRSSEAPPRPRALMPAGASPSRRCTPGKPSLTTPRPKAAT